MTQKALKPDDSGKLCHVLRDYEVIQSSLSNVAKNENEADNSAEKDFRFGQCTCSIIARRT